MLSHNPRILDESLYTVKFGINGGLTVVRSLSFDKLLELSIDNVKLLFQPSNSSKVRQFGLEAVTNGRINGYRVQVIWDVSDLTELAASISCQQFRDPVIKKAFIKEYCSKVKPRSKEGEAFFSVLLDMFEKDEIEITLNHPIQFGRLYNTAVDDELGYLVERVTKNFHLIKKIFFIKLGNNFETKETHFVTGIFPSIVRTLNTVTSEGRRIRGCREIAKHRKDVLSNKYFDYTPAETEGLVKLLDRAIEEISDYETITE